MTEGQPITVLLDAPDTEGSLQNTLLILGAGASAPQPCGLPLFNQLFAAVMQGMGWYDEGNRRWSHKQYGSFTSPDLSPEVLFGSLAADHVEFATQIAQRMSHAEHNAVHVYAATVLRDNGCVWTTNMDTAVERACQQWPVTAARAWTTDPSKLVPLQSAGPGVLVKFHGTVDVPTSLAFADRDLLTPLEDHDRVTLESLASDRDVVLYGYAAADADLADLLEEVFRSARTMRWFEPNADTREKIRSAFPDLPNVFDPPAVPDDSQWKEAIRRTARAFLDHVDSRSVPVSPKLRRDLLIVNDTLPETLKLPHPPPGVTSARLVERWGSPQAARRALGAARRNDLLNLRISSLRAHLRWAVSNRLYRGKVAPAAVRLIAPRPRLLRLLPKPGLRDYVLTRHLALLLQDHDWQALETATTLTDQIRTQLNLPPSPADRYYMAQARRYQLRPSEARNAADQAAHGLSLLQDPERLAGAIYESGSAAIYQADFSASLRSAFDLRHRRGRYAIPRWPAWGAWLEVITRCHLNEPEAAERILNSPGCQRFLEEQRADALADLRTAQLLLYRVQIANDLPADPTVLTDPADAQRKLRYRDDLDLILADIAIAEDRRSEAAERLARVAAHPSCAVAGWWAALGRAELKRTDEPGAAADEFAALADDAHSRGATWLELQAVLGLTACSDPREQATWARVRGELPRPLRRASAAELAIGTPRVLWMLTV